MFLFICSGYAFLWKHLCLYVLKTMKLCSEEKAYLENDGPQIVQLYYESDLHFQMGGCPEARNAKREADKLAEIARQKLTLANVSEVRQKFLEKLLFETHEGYLKSFPPRKLGNLVHHFKCKWREGAVQMIFKSLFT